MKWIELHDSESQYTIIKYTVNIDHICMLYQGYTGSGRAFTRVALTSGKELCVHETVKEIIGMIYREG